MKTHSGLFILLMFGQAVSIYASAPTFNVYITNESYPASKTFRFEIWIKKTGPGILEIANLQFGINLNSGFRNGSSITPAIIPGSSMFVAMEDPASAGIGYVNNAAAGTDRLNISGRFNPGCGSGTIIPDSGNSCTSPGIRFATVQLTTGLQGWPAGIKPNLDFNFIHLTTLETKISYYPQPCPSTGFNATSKGTFYDWNSAVVSCTQNPVTPGCSLITSTNVNSLLQTVCSGGTGSFSISNTFSSMLTGGQARYSIDGKAAGVAASQGTSAGFLFAGVEKGIHLITIERGSGFSTAFPFDGGTTLCTATIYVTLAEPLPVNATASLVSPVLCYGENGIIEVTATGGSGNYKYVGGTYFSSSPVDLLVVPSGKYSFAVTDQNNCPAAITDTIYLDEARHVMINSITSVNAGCSSCNDGSATVNAGDGTSELTLNLSALDNSNLFSISGTGPEFIFYGLIPGNYQVDVITNAGCLAETDTLYISGCTDSIFYTAEICAGDFYVLPDGHVVDTTGIFFTTLNGLSGCDTVILTKLTVKTCDVTLSLRIFFQGFYLGNEKMKAVFDPINFPGVFDSVMVELHDSISPYNLLFRATGVCNTDGYASFIFPGLVEGNNYFIVTRHRNSVLTWSRSQINFNSTNVSYDFTRE